MLEELSIEFTEKRDRIRAGLQDLVPAMLPVHLLIVAVSYMYTCISPKCR